MSDRTYEQMRRDAWTRYEAIRADDEQPGDYHFPVTPMERATLCDHPPFMLPEMNMERSTFFGMRIIEIRPRE